MTTTKRDYSNPIRPLPGHKWTDVDSIQNFAEAALEQAQRFAREAADEGREEREHYFRGGVYYAKLILDYIKNTGIDADIKAQGGEQK